MKKCPETGQYIVRLPFIVKKSILTGKYKICYAKARQHQANMIKKPHNNPQYKNQLVNALNILINENQIEFVDINKHLSKIELLESNN